MEIVRMSDKQWASLSKICRRELIQVLIFVDTDSYKYSLGANGDWWVLFRRDSTNNVEEVDRWL